MSSTNAAIHERQQLEYEEQQLQQELDNLENEIIDRESTMKASKERQEKVIALQRETDAMNIRIGEVREYLAEADEAMRDFPTDADRQAAKSKLDTLELALTKAEESVETCTTGLKAYEQRREKNMEIMVGLNEVLLQALRALETQAESYIMQDASVKKVDDILKGCEEMTKTDVDRETYLVDVLKALESVIAEEERQDQEIIDAKAQIAESIPAIEEEKDDILANIEMLWEEERTHLQAIYQRLLTLNMEQHYHLGRGTHIKASGVDYSEVTEKGLESKQARLTADTIATSARLNDIHEDVVELQRHCEQTRQRGRLAEQAFNKELSQREDILAEARTRLGEAEEECNELRNVKAELTMALQRLKDPKTVMLATSARVGAPGATRSGSKISVM